MIVRLDQSVDLQAKIADLETALAPVATDGYAVTVGMQGGATTNTLNVIVSAEDPAAVAATTEAVQAALAGVEGLDNITSDLVKAAPEVQVRVDPNKALGVGFTTAQVGAEIRTALTPTTVGLIQVGDADPVDLVFRLDAASLTSVDALKALPVGTTVRVPLAAIADVTQADVQSRITRIDESPSATISAEITSGDTGAASVAVQGVIDDLRADGTIPPAVSVELGGVLQQQAEAFGGLFAAMGIAILLVYLMMVLAFNSLVTPFIILFSLPLATIGAFPALLITDRPIGLSALIGFLMLIGIVVTNAIVLLDLVERLRREGMSTHDALVAGRPHPPPADPHDRDRDDPRARAARGGLQRGLDHRGRARDGRDRRARQLDDPDAARDPGDLLARRRPQGPDRAAAAAGAGGAGDCDDRGGGRGLIARRASLGPRAGAGPQPVGSVVIANA